MYESINSPGGEITLSDSMSNSHDAIYKSNIEMSISTKEKFDKNRFNMSVSLYSILPLSGNSHDVGQNRF